MVGGSGIREGEIYNRDKQAIEDRTGTEHKTHFRTEDRTGHGTGHRTKDKSGKRTGVMPEKMTVDETGDRSDRTGNQTVDRTRTEQARS